ncbi:MAG: pentapeptide repeat-containing protein [Halobacteriota archaeon]
MANDVHLELLKQGVDIWNAWRKEHPEVTADLTGADLSGADLSQADLSHADLTGANLSAAKLARATLSKAWLSDANLYQADLTEASLSQADLHGANLTEGVLTKADLSKANLVNATLIDTIVAGSTFVGCKVHGISVWNLHGEPEAQKDLLITKYFPPFNESAITVDNLAVAQFIYLLRENKAVRNVLTALTTKAVLLLGRFGDENTCLTRLLMCYGVKSTSQSSLTLNR